MKMKRLSALVLGLALLAGCDNGTEPGPVAEIAGTWTAQSFPGRQADEFRLTLTRNGSNLTGTFTTITCGATTCDEDSDPVSGVFDGQSVATLSGGVTPDIYAIRAVLRSQNQLDVTIGLATGTFTR